MAETFEAGQRGNVQAGPTVGYFAVLPEGESTTGGASAPAWVESGTAAPPGWPDQSGGTPVFLPEKRFLTVPHLPHPCDPPQHPAPWVPPARPQQGWECPVCGRVWAPFVPGPCNHGRKSGEQPRRSGPTRRRCPHPDGAQVTDAIRPYCRNCGAGI